MGSGIKKCSSHLQQEEITRKLMHLDDLSAKMHAEGVPNSYIANMRTEKILELHPYAIMAPNKSCIYWTSYFRKEGGDRQKIYGNTKEDLCKKLFDCYCEHASISLDGAYELWCEYRHTLSLSPSTLRRDSQRWLRYFANTDFVANRIRDIDDLMIEEYIHLVIGNFKPKKKELNEILRILRAIFRYAVKHSLIFDNPIEKIEINKAGCAPKTRKSDKSRVYLRREEAIILQECINELKLCPDSTIAIGIQLDFKLGLRIGEWAALRESDIDREDMTIHIQRMETKDENDKPVIVDYLKKKSEDSNRFLPLSTSDLEKIDRIIQINHTYGFADEDYIFVNEKGRIHIRAIDNRIRKLCRRGGIPEKSSHDIRRTVASKLHAKGVPIEKIRQYLGHADISTTWSYIYDIDDEKDTQRQLLAALAD